MAGPARRVAGPRGDDPGVLAGLVSGHQCLVRQEVDALLNIQLGILGYYTGHGWYTRCA